MPNLADSRIFENHSIKNPSLSKRGRYPDRFTIHIATKKEDFFKAFLTFPKVIFLKDIILDTVEDPSHEYAN
jgi:hypothetical protein